MSRCVLIPSRGDPITLRLVFHYFETIWQDEVDKLYLNVNSTCEPEVIKFIEKFTKHPKVVFSYDDHSLDHGGSLTKMFKQGSEDHIAFFEDDSLVYRKNEVNRHFEFIEKSGYDAGGALRWSCSGELIDRAREWFHLEAFQYGPGGWFWPCFFFAKRSDVTKTDLNFCGHNWKIGDKIPPMQWVAPSPLDADTFVWFSMQMRALGLRFFEIPTPDDVTNQGFGWVHTTSLSSPMESLLTDDDGCPIALRKHPSYHIVKPTCAAGGELEKKMGWMRLCLEKFDYSEIQSFKDVYERAITRAISAFALSESNINNFKSLYKNALGI